MKTDLSAIPVKSYSNPHYPTKQEVLLHPDVLRLTPVRWGAKPAVCLALMLSISTGLYGCNRPIPGPRSEGGPLALAIPVFEHGNGHGSFGCVSVAPPVFLSEDEAAQAIRQEAEAMGVHFDGSLSLEGTFPATNLYGDKAFAEATRTGTLDLDGYDPALGIGFEFVSQNDVVAWQQTGRQSSSVETYDMKGTAKRLAGSVENVAVFYDPGQNWDEFMQDRRDGISDFNTYYAQYSAEQKERMLDDLRAQVRDFLSWLAAQGVI